MGNKILAQKNKQGFSQQQVEYIRDKFDIIADDNGILNKDLFAQSYRCSKKQSQLFIRSIDYSSDGKIQFYNFLCAVASFCISDIKQKGKMIFEIYSKTDNDPQLSKAQLLMFTRTAYLFNQFVLGKNDCASDQMVRVLCKQDQGNDLQVEQRKLIKIKQKEINDLNDRIFLKWDFNKNNSLSKQEFHQIIRKDPLYRLWMHNMGMLSKLALEGQIDDDYDLVTQDIITRSKRDIELYQARKIGADINAIQQQQGQFKIESNKGDQAGVSPPWLGQVKYMTPSSFKPIKQTAPDELLDIEYVYGYRSYDTRNNLKYNAQGYAIYHTAGVGIILNQKTNKQLFNISHMDDITCLDVNINGTLVATGQMGNYPLLIVWDAITGNTKFIFKGILRKSIANVVFNKQGDLLAANSNNDDHTLAIYDLRQAQKLEKEINNKLTPCKLSGPCSKSLIICLAFAPDNKTIIAGCPKQILFISIDKKIRSKRGMFGRATVCSTIALCFLGSNLYSGMSNGAMLSWKGQTCTQVIKIHQSAVTAIDSRDNKQLITGTLKGIIRILTPKMQVLKIITLTNIISSNNSKVISICHNNNNVLLGLRGGQIYQMDNMITKGTIIQEGHYDGQLWGLTTHNKKEECYTAGQDKLLMHWNLKTNKLIKKKKMSSSLRHTDINHNGTQLAVGHKNGLVIILNPQTFQQIAIIKKYKNPDKEVCSLVKFSPNGKILAVGYAPPISKVFLYQTNNFKSYKICKGSPSRIHQLDFSQSSDQIMLNNTSYQVLFYNSFDGKQITSGSTLKDQQWDTFSCGHSWSTQGIWPPCSDGTDINSLARSHNRKVLATGDDFSKIKLFRFPANETRQPNNAYKGHSSHITCVKFTIGDKYLISTGGLQKSIIQWAYSGSDYIPQEQQIKQQQEQQQEQEQQYDQFAIEQDTGDKAMAVKPYLGQVMNSIPSWYKQNKRRDNVIPKQDLQLNYAYGLRNQYINDQIRNQVRYSSTKQQVIFPTACIGVKMNKKTKQQQFFNVHLEDLISFDVDSTGRVAATGQMAQKNKLHPLKKIVDVIVWDTIDMKQLARFTGFHVAAIILVKFSPSGKYLLTVGQDSNHTIAVYSWRQNTIVWNAKTSRGKLNAAIWMTDQQYMTCGVSEARFWRKNKGHLGKLSGKWDIMCSCITFKKNYLSGSASGKIYLWNGAVASKGLQAHRGKVQCFANLQNIDMVLSGADDGNILSWVVSGGKINSGTFSFSFAQTPSPYDKGILSMQTNDSTILIGTKGSQIYQIKDKKAYCIMQAHQSGQLWGCASSPNDYSFVTGGDDKTVRLWNVNKKRMIKGTKYMKFGIRAVDWSRSNVIVVGDQGGNIYLFNSDLQLLDTKQSKLKSPMQIIKFSPNSAHFVFGCHEYKVKNTLGALQLMDVDNKIGQSRLIKVGFTSAILNIDWDKDSALISSVSQAYELKFMSVASLKDVSASSIRDVNWDTWSCKFGFPVMGIFQGVDYTDVNTVCRSHNMTMLVSGNDDQLIRLFKYPCVVPGQVHKSYNGHSSHVTRVCFSYDDKYLFSIGGNDRTILVWEVKGVEQKQEEIDLGDEGDEDIDYPKMREYKQENIQIDPFDVEIHEGDQFMAIKPWLGAIKQPDQFYKGNTYSPPQVNVTLEHCHGYRVKDCRNNLHYINNNLIVYHAAAVGIIHNIKSNKQQFFIEHNDDILSLAITEDKKRVATGELGPKPLIFIWDPFTMKKIMQWKAPIKKGVCGLAFNSQGNYLAAVAIDTDHHVCVLDTQNGTVLAVEKGDRNPILELSWSQENQFISVGVKHYKVWKISGKTLSGQLGKFSGKSNQIVCVKADNGDIYTGTGNCSVYSWTGTTIKQSILLQNDKIQSKPIDSLKINKEHLIAGSKYGKIYILTKQLKKLNQINIRGMLGKLSRNPGVRAIDIIDKNNLLLGLFGSQIVNIKLEQDYTQDKVRKQSQKFIIQAHYAPNTSWLNQVWGLAISPDGKHYYTCSDDATLRVYNIQNRQQQGATSLNFNIKATVSKYNQNDKTLHDPLDAKTKDYMSCAKGRCIGVSPINGNIIVGCLDGTLRIFTKDLVPIHRLKNAAKQISSVKYTPDGRNVVAVSHDSKIYCYSVQYNDKLKRLCRPIKKHTSAVLHFDFSRDGGFIHSTCRSYQLLFFDIQRGKQITSGASNFKNEQWASWTVPLGWPVQGIWPQCADGTDINAIDRSHNKLKGKQYYMLASADDWGKLRILKYPSLRKASQGVIGKGHSSHVTCCRWTLDDNRVITSGGEDQTIMQWLIQ